MEKTSTCGARAHLSTEYAAPDGAVSFMPFYYKYVAPMALKAWREPRRAAFRAAPLGAEYLWKTTGKEEKLRQGRHLPP